MGKPAERAADGSEGGSGEEAKKSEETKQRVAANAKIGTRGAGVAGSTAVLAIGWADGAMAHEESSGGTAGQR